MVKFVPVVLKQLKTNANEGTSSSGMMGVGAQEQGKKRKRGENNCHQCHRNDRARVVRCCKCNSKKYCILCITKRYPSMDEAAFIEACASCRNICNCKACSRANDAHKKVEDAIPQAANESLENLDTVTRPPVPVNPEQNQREGSEARPSFATMKQQLEAMLVRLEREGHRVEPGLREHLQTGIHNLLQRIHASERVSPSS